jgi:hypothetical protein
MARARKGVEPAEPRRRIAYFDSDGLPTDDAAQAVSGEVLEYDPHDRPARRTRFFLDRSELPWLPVSEPAFLLWVLAALFVAWLGIGLFLGLA